MNEHSTIVYPIRDSLYINLNNRCTLKCVFCPKFNGSWQVHDYDLALDHKPSAQAVIDEIKDPTPYDEIVFCGFGEPTLRLKELIEVAQWVKHKGGNVRVNTDGLANLAHKRNVLPELAKCVDSLSISMNAQSEAVYNHHCKPGLEHSWRSMMEFVAEAPQYISDVTATAIEGLEGVDVAACEALANALGVKFRKRTLDVVG
ncbi:TatD family nuclease-associated radical SAM protein [Alkalimarinus alittae]|uniref:TatD family nuclease-associated radical SAM protein n=1 Tax=Alkalimarinus alittae TaxID=2961619 RepID=A0ABY6N663_9ALTE|nr:TatD family nuclease-associated radical SAM protein [Alkalimarinus alittae]UZE97616.1 TatD family nuclease-associated radical SAM protein [Alkalimarinus alittae]